MFSDGCLQKTHLARDELELRLLVCFFQCMHECLVVQISEINPREDVFDQSVEPGGISKRQLGQSVQSQRLNHQLCLLN